MLPIGRAQTHGAADAWRCTLAVGVLGRSAPRPSQAPLRRCAGCRPGRSSLLPWHHAAAAHLSGDRDISRALSLRAAAADTTAASRAACGTAADAAGGSAVGEEEVEVEEVVVGEVGAPGGREGFCCSCGWAGGREEEVGASRRWASGWGGGAGGAGGTASSPQVHVYMALRAGRRGGGGGDRGASQAVADGDDGQLLRIAAFRNAFCTTRSVRC